MDNRNTNGNYQVPNGQPRVDQTQYLFPPNNPQTTPFQQPQAGYNNQYGAQQYANPNAQYTSQDYSANQTPNNYYYPQQANPNYDAYAPKKKKGSPLLYVLIAVISVCFVAVAALCVYFVMDSGSDARVERPSYSEPKLQQTTQAPTETATEAPVIATEAPVIATEPPVVATEAPQMQTEEPSTFFDDYGYIDELNRRYNNYFDFYPDANGYVIADSSYRIISKQDLYGMTEHEVCIARNEIYARYGYIFQTEKYNEYFQNFSWYRPSTHSLPALNSIEAQNVNTIMAYENERGW